MTVLNAIVSEYIASTDEGAIVAAYFEIDEITGDADAYLANHGHDALKDRLQRDSDDCTESDVLKFNDTFISITDSAEDIEKNDVVEARYHASTARNEDEEDDGIGTGYFEVVRVISTHDSYEAAAEECEDLRDAA